MQPDASSVAPPVEGSYPWYPPLDLDKIPWQTESGPWGPRVPLQAPAAPETTRDVTVNSLADFNTAAGVAGSRITIGADMESGLVIRASDIDVILPAGRSVGSVEIGSWPRETLIERVRIRGSLDGSRGGRMGQFRSGELGPENVRSVVTDVIIDGVDMNGAADFGASGNNQAFRTSAHRLAVVNCRVIAAGYAWGGSASHVVIANSNFFHGAATRASLPFIEGWGIRNTRGPIVIIDSRIQGTRYHNIRAQSVGGTEELLYITRSKLVALAEGKTAWMWNNLGNGNFTAQGAILEDNDIYTYAAGGCSSSRDLSPANVAYSRVRNNRFHGGGTAVFDQSYLNGQAAGGGGDPGDHDWSEGNTFETIGEVPGWSGPGDPTEVPLPDALQLEVGGEAPCLAGP